MMKKTLWCKFVIFICMMTAYNSFAAITQFDLFDNEDNRLMYVTMEYQGGKIVSQTLYDGFDGSKYVLKQITPQFDTDGRVTHHDYFDYDSIIVNGASYTYNGSNTSFQLNDHFIKGNVAYKGSYTTSANSFQFSNKSGTKTHVLDYSDVGGNGKIDIFSASGTKTHYITTSSQVGINDPSSSLAADGKNISMRFAGSRGFALELSLERKQKLSIELYDLVGRQPAQFEDRIVNSGDYKLSYSIPQTVASGICFVRVVLGNQTLIQKLNFVEGKLNFVEGNSINTISPKSTYVSTSHSSAKTSASSALDVVDPGLITEILYFYDELPGVNKPEYLSPVEIETSTDGSNLFVAQYSGRRVDIVDAAGGNIISSTQLPAPPTSLALSADKSVLYVSCYSYKRPMGVLCVLDAATGDLQKRIPAGHSPRGLSVSPSGKVYVCNQFSDEVSLIDPVSGTIEATIPVEREPFESALTPDGSKLIVNNYLPNGRSDVDTLAAKVSIISTATNQVEKEIELCNGAQSLNDICISPDGQYAYISHIRSLHTMTPLNVIEQGWINANAVSVIDIPSQTYLGLFLLDDFGSGAGNPWGIRCTEGQLTVISSGSEELHVVNRTKLHQEIVASGKDLSLSLSFSISFTERKRTTVKGPRSLAMYNDLVYVAGYFSDNIQVFNIADGSATNVTVHDLGPQPTMDMIRLGEYNFYNTSKMCLQGWQSCGSCHPNGRSDALKWDLENDGLGNFKNDKSLLYSHITPPVMITGVRQTAEVATRKGVELILFLNPNSVEEEADAIDEYLKTMRHVPSPYLINGELSESAKAGKVLFKTLECGACHVPQTYYTDFSKHAGIKAAGDTGPWDGSWDTPTLYEIWRSGPYMHDGRSAEIEEIFAAPTKHGVPTLTDTNISDLAEYMRSL